MERNTYDCIRFAEARREGLANIVNGTILRPSSGEYRIKVLEVKWST